MGAGVVITGTSKCPVLFKFRSSLAFILLMVATAVFTDIFPYNVLVPVLPFVLETRAGVGKESVQSWVSISMAAYGAAILVSAPIWGVLADRTKDRRTPMLAGLVLVGAGTLILCFMQNVAMLVVGRVLQGMSSALTWSVGLALIVDTVPAERVGWAMGWMGIALALGTLSSPLLGGLVFSEAGYIPVWAMCFALVALDMMLRLLAIEAKPAAKWRQAATTTESQVSTIQTAASESSTSTSTGDIEEKRGGHPIAFERIPDPEAYNECKPEHASLKETFGLFTSPRLLTALWGTVAEAMVLEAFNGTLPLFVKELFGWDATGAGLIFLPLVLPTCLGPVVGCLCDRYGPRWLSAFGFLLYTPFLVCLRFVSEDTIAHKVGLCGLLAGIGVGVSFTFGPVTSEITFAIEERCEHLATKPIALGYALYNIAFSAGAAAGPLLGGFVKDRAGFSTVGWSLATISMTTSMLCAAFIGGPPLWKKGGISRLQKKTDIRKECSESGQGITSG